VLKLATDEDVNGAVIRGLQRRAELDLVRSQDAGLAGQSDADVLEWAASEGRILITNDRNTMIGSAYQRVQSGQSMPGLISTSNSQTVGQAIDDILVIAECMAEDEIRNQVVVFLPL
jgi:hypothetical protein